MHKSELKKYCTPTVIVAHPDDEVISSSQMLYYLRDRIHIVYATDGDADSIGIAEQVRLEAQKALGILGINKNIHFLDIPEFEFYKHILEIRRRLVRILLEINPDLVITHAYEGGHFDHDLLRLVIDIIQRDGELTSDIAEFALYHDVNGVNNHNTFIDNIGQEILFHPRTEDIERKQKAFNAYKSQDCCLAEFNTDIVERVRFLCQESNDVERFRSRPHKWQLGYERKDIIKNYDLFKGTVTQLLDDN